MKSCQGSRSRVRYASQPDCALCPAVVQSSALTHVAAGGGAQYTGSQEDHIR